MTSEEIRMLIPQYLSGQLSAAEEQLFEERLKESPELRIETAHRIKPVEQIDPTTRQSLAGEAVVASPAGL